jgi:hypothetical protein
MQILRTLHWLIPWLILIVGIYAIVRFAGGFINDRPFTASNQRLVILFSGLMDLQAAVGLIYFLWIGFSAIGFPLHRILHGTVMLVAVIIPHFSSRWKNADDSTRHLNNFYLLLTSFLLMLVGLSLIP